MKSESKDIRNVLFTYAQVEDFTFCLVGSQEVCAKPQADVLSFCHAEKQSAITEVSAEWYRSEPPGAHGGPEKPKRDSDLFIGPKQKFGELFSICASEFTGIKQYFKSVGAKGVK